MAGRQGFAARFAIFDLNCVVWRALRAREGSESLLAPLGTAEVLVVLLYPVDQLDGWEAGILH